MSGSFNTFQQGIPNLSTPIVDGQGRLTAPWARVMQSLLGRTGGTPGVNSDQLAASVSAASTSATQAGAQAQAAALSASQAKTAAAAAQTSASQATLLAMGDTTTAAIISDTGTALLYEPAPSPTPDQTASLLALFMES